jgi:hypothetical protein
MLARLLVITGLVSAGLLLILLTSIAPADAGAFGILAVFLLSYVSLLSVLTFVLWATVKLIDRVGRDFHVLKKTNSLPLKKAYYYSTVVALGPIIIISLQSVGSVSIYELGLVVTFITLGCIYVARRTT